MAAIIGDAHDGRQGINDACHGDCAAPQVISEPNCPPLPRPVDISRSPCDRSVWRPVRSFKARGTEVVASLLAGNGSRAAVCASAGNLGQALAWSGRGRGLDVTVVASRFAPAAKLDRIRALDARLELVDGDFDMARERAAAIARYDGIRLVVTAWTSRPARGATIGLERVDTVPSFDAVLIALGGGALATGVGHVVKARAPECAPQRASRGAVS
jgi:threonine dehydratase